MSVRAVVPGFLLALTALRLLFIGQVELSPDEAYYQMWSERLDWAYFSKGPGVALAIRAGTGMFGVNEFGVRFFSPLLALGTSLALFALARRLHGAGAAAWAVLALNLTPLFTAGSLLMTIDPLSVFFWSVAMLAGWRALETRDALASLGWWALVGLGVGFGFLCKYTNAMELVSIALALAWVPRWRREFRRPGVYLTLLLAAGCAAPPILWNAEHDWVTVGHLSARGGLDTAFALRPGEFGKFLLGLAGVYSPLVFLGMLAALGWAWRRQRRTAGAAAGEVEKTRFLLAFTLPLLVGYALLALKSAGEPNWTAPAFLSLGILAAARWHRVARESRPARVFCLAALLTAAPLSLLALNTDLLRAAGTGLSYRKEPTARLRGWRTFAETVAELRRKTEREAGAPVFLIAAKYGTAAELNFYLPADARRADRPGHPPVYLPESQSFETQFSFWPGYDEVPVAADNAAAPALPPDAQMTAEAEFARVGQNPYLGRSALLVVEGDRRSRPPSSVESGFERIEPLARYEVRRRGRDLRVLQVFLCSNYQGAPL